MYLLGQIIEVTRKIHKDAGDGAAEQDCDALRNLLYADQQSAQEIPQTVIQSFERFLDISETLKTEPKLLNIAANETGERSIQLDQENIQTYEMPSTISGHRPQGGRLYTSPYTSLRPTSPSIPVSIGPESVYSTVPNMQPLLQYNRRLSPSSASTFVPRRSGSSAGFDIQAEPGTPGARMKLQNRGVNRTARGFTIGNRSAHVGVATVPHNTSLTPQGQLSPGPQYQITPPVQESPLPSDANPQEHSFQTWCRRKYIPNLPSTLADL